MANTGAVIHLSADGEAEIERGLIRSEDAAGDTADDEDTHAAARQTPPAPSLPATLIEHLTAQKTAAILQAPAFEP